MPAALFINNAYFSSTEFIIMDYKIQIFYKSQRTAKLYSQYFDFLIFSQMYTVLKSTFSHLNTNCEDLNAEHFMCVIQTLFLSINSTYFSNKIHKAMNT